MDENVIDLLQKGEVGVLPTDTIYGIVAKALNPKAVEKIYQIKGRKPDKPLIILISSVNDLDLFNINIDSSTKNFLENIWPNKISVILPCKNDKLTYLHRNTNTLAFRLPNYPELIKLLKETGPLVAPSANPEGLRPAKTIEEAKQYFQEKASFYIDKGILISEPSTLIKIENNQITVLRTGAAEIPAKKSSNFR